VSLGFDIGQGAGLAGASGVRPFLPPILTGALASGDIGVDFDNTSFDWVESPGFLLVVLAIAVAVYAYDRRAPKPQPGERSQVQAIMVVLSMIFGAILFAASLSAGGETEYPGVIAGFACALLGYAAVALLFLRARARLEGGAAALLNLYADSTSLAIAVLAILFPPLGYVVLVGFVVLLIRAQQGGDRKYEGLRILR
jgi:uncharacterized membrane protein YhaH (DUF805 family)